MLATINFTADERDSGRPRDGNLTSAATALRAQGCVVLENVFVPEHIEHLRSTYLSRHPGLPDSRPPSGSGAVGHRRFQTPLEISGPFNSPAIYANPLVLPILDAVLGEDLVIGACGVVTSLPGAGEQHCHRDGPPLFNEGLNRISPAHALDLFIPLLDLNGDTGTTRVFPKSHLSPDSALPQIAPVEPVIRVGSCMIIDYRLFHQGLANRSDRVRPLMYLVFHKPWFKDYRNHGTTPFLRLTESDATSIPAGLRRLFRWTEHYRTGLY